MSLLHAAGRFCGTLTRVGRTMLAGDRQEKRDLANFVGGLPDGGAGGEAPGTGRPLRLIDLVDVWPAERPVALTELSSSAHNVSLQDLTTLVALAILADAKQLFEFGTFDGRTGVNLLRNLPAAYLRTLDLPEEHAVAATREATGGGVGHRLKRASDLDGRFEMILTGSDAFDPEPMRRQVQFIFVDAGHDYAHVRDDTAKADVMLAEAGVLAWHDYGHLRGAQPFPGLTRAVEEYVAGHRTETHTGVCFRSTRVAALLPTSLLKGT